MAQEQIIVRTKNSSVEFFERERVASHIVDLILGETGIAEVYNVTTDEIMLEINLDELTLSWQGQFAQYVDEGDLAIDVVEIILKGHLS